MARRSTALFAGVNSGTTAKARRWSRSIASGQVQGDVRAVTRAQYDARLTAAVRRFDVADAAGAKRGELIRDLGERLRAGREALGELVSHEAGKIRAEGIGEVQEMIDICDFAVGLSRQLHGLTIASERPRHRLMEQWHPLGAAGIVTAFNFPVAVWAWNAALAAVCGDVCIWKPSPLTPLCSAAVHAICEQVAAAHGAQGVFSLVPGGGEVGAWLCDDPRVPLVSFTGSIATGRIVAGRVAARLGRTILELGGNNGAIFLDDATRPRRPGDHVRFGGDRRPALHHDPPAVRAARVARSLSIAWSPPTAPSGPAAG